MKPLTIKEYIKMKGLTQKEIADQIGCNLTTLNFHLSGKYKMSALLINRMAVLLRITKKEVTENKLWEPDNSSVLLTKVEKSMDEAWEKNGERFRKC